MISPLLELSNFVVYICYYLIDLHRTDKYIQILKLWIFLWGNLKELAKLVGIEGVAASQVEGSRLRGYASL